MDTLDHILIVDDDVEICQLLSQYLNKNGYKTSIAHEGRAMWQVLDTTHIDLIVLDLMLPGDDGLTLCRNLRAQSNMPVIMLTALGEETDRIVGLEMGADDYLPKPFSARELLARIKGVLRRTRTLPPSSRLNKQQTPAKWRFGPWLLDSGQRHLIDSAGVMTALSSTEYRLLLVFLNHPEHVLSRDQLMDLTQGRDANPLDRIIDVQVSRLRARLLDDPKEPTLIKTIRNEGYVLAVPVELVP
ncbi:MAG: response regulator [Neisseriaceae bacterium]|nr:response regulator [Neisseriaceae bacterium]MBP6861511.1 response regulator [Neisseriaceae bacterium]